MKDFDFLRIWHFTSSHQMAFEWLGIVDSKPLFYRWVKISYHFCCRPMAKWQQSKMINNWHKSIAYREKCYKRTAKIHSYLEKGIITEQEYEETRKDILKHIQ